MQINTKFIGSIEVDEKDIIHFEHGIPGFHELHRFALLPMAENPALHYLQSIEEENICFVVVNPFTILADYEIDISEDTVQGLSIEQPDDISLYSILTIPEEVKDITANLAAPIVINNTNNKAVQEILNTDKYSIKHRVF